jgi:hypothetical protein
MLMAMEELTISPAWQYVMTIPEIPPTLLLVLMHFGVISLSLWEILAITWIGTFLSVLIFMAIRVIRGRRNPVPSQRV